MKLIMQDVGDAREDVSQSGLRIDVVELRRGNEAQHEGGALTFVV